MYHAHLVFFSAELKEAAAHLAILDALRNDVGEIEAGRTVRFHAVNLG
jgi:anthranilate/para-aminobenzoate synthase component I